MPSNGRASEAGLASGCVTAVATRSDFQALEAPILALTPIPPNSTNLKKEKTAKTEEESAKDQASVDLHQDVAQPIVKEETVGARNVEFSHCRLWGGHV